MNTSHATAPSLDRWIAAALLSTLIAILASTALAAFGLPTAVAIGLAAVGAVCGCLVLAKRLPPGIDALRRKRPLLAFFWLLLAVAALGRTVGIAWFMLDPQAQQASAFGFDQFYTRHSCMSGYWHAAELADQHVKNVYLRENYAGFYGIFKIDEYLYLPQFLILPMLGVAAGLDFDQMRGVWFALQGLIVLLCALGVAKWIGGPAGRRAALLIPAVWIATPTALTLQLGNFQLSAIALSLMAFALFWRNKPILGGALFGFAVFKLFPGLLGIYLILTKRWRALFWTLGFSSLYTVIAFLWLGENPFRALFEFHLPRLASGEAWAFLEIPQLAPVAAINDSVPGVVLKLKALGVPGMDMALSRHVGWVWTLFIVTLTALAARRAPRMSRHELAMTWTALLALAAFRSPFLPDHTGLFAPLWLWSLVAAGGAFKGGRLFKMALLWLAFAAVVPFMGTPLDDGLDRFVVSGISQTVAIALCLWAVLRKPTGIESEDARPANTAAQALPREVEAQAA
ncbi:MAG: DUF2029 domain-containing protein [Lysobacter sp.]|nr:DUF2029 domain-containing protein [Lysobacter sp.]